MEYAPFEPLPEDKLRHETNRHHAAQVRHDAIQEIVRTRQLVELKSDYLDRSSFWLTPDTREILQVQSDGGPQPTFYTPAPEHYTHIAELNELPTARCALVPERRTNPHNQH